MILETRLGSIEIKDDKIISFKNGILGLEEQKEYILLDHPGTDIIKWLQSLKDGDIALPVINPGNFFPKYSPKISQEDLNDLSIKDTRQAVVLCVINIPEDIEQITVNLKAPIVINTKTRLADQLIAQNPNYSTREPINFTDTSKDGRCESC